MLRSLIHHRRVNLAVVLGSAVTCACLTGALLVGDSVRGSLAGLTRQRLGRIDQALVAERYIGESLAGELARRLGPGAAVAPAILLRGTASHAGTRARAAGINLLGVEERFAALYPPAPAGAGLPPAPGGGPFPPVLLNEALARQLGASAGDEVILTFPRDSDVPRDSLLGRRELEEVVGRIRCRVAAIVPPGSFGRFDLSAGGAFPLNAYLSLADLQQAARRPGRVNALFVAQGPGSAGPDLQASMRDLLQLDDLGMILSRTSSWVFVQSREFVLKPEVESAVRSIASEMSLPMQSIQTYLANELRAGARAIPYSTVTALDRAGPPFSPLLLADGSSASPPGDDEILVNEWAARQLAAAAGDRITLTYFVIGEREQLRTERATLRVAGVVAMSGLAADRALTPDYPGIQDAADISAWDPPFPVDLTAVRPDDERYWDEHGATPKAFVSAATGRRLWSSRYGTATSIRIAPLPGSTTAELAARLDAEIRRRVPLDLFGLSFRDVRREGLAASEGATDFGALFLGFSLFLIASCALLTSLLFRLGVEVRSREIGLLRAVGFGPAEVRRRFLAEGMTLAGLGALAGTAGAVGYAGLMMLGLRTIWSDAVGGSELSLHVRPASLALGAAVSLAVVAAGIVLGLRRVGALPVPALLAGQAADSTAEGPGRLSRVILWGALAASGLLLAAAMAGAPTSSSALFFGTGAALLAASLSGFTRWCRAGVSRLPLRPGPGALGLMAARNTSWNPGRSALCVALIGSACFVIVTVAASRRGPEDSAGRGSPSGGFTLIAETEIPLHQDLASPSGRSEMGLSPEAGSMLAQATVVPMRRVAGEDASCRNLHRPSRPGLLGAPAELIRRGGFRFHSAQGDASDPWSLLEADLGPGVIPALGDQNSVLWILHLRLGSDLALRDELGRQVRLRFVGLLDHSPIQSDLIISERRLLEHFPGTSGYSVFLIEAPADRAAGLGRLLEEDLSDAGLDAQLVDERIAAYAAVEDTYLSTFELLGGLGLILGTAGLGVVVARNVLERRAELAALRAIGFRRRRLAAMVLAENAFLLLVGMGAGGASALVASAPRLIEAASGPSWGSLAALLGLVLVVGMLASVAAARSALRAPMLPALREER